MADTAVTSIQTVSCRFRSSTVSLHTRRYSAKWSAGQGPQYIIQGRHWNNVSQGGPWLADHLVIYHFRYEYIAKWSASRGQGPHAPLPLIYRWHIIYVRNIGWNIARWCGCQESPPAPLHYGLSSVENLPKCFPQASFLWISIISDKIFGDCLLSSFTFDIYSGPLPVIYRWNIGQYIARWSGGQEGPPAPLLVIYIGGT